MKKNFLLLIGLMFFSFVSAQTTLKILSYNIHGGYDASMKDIANFIKLQNPDIVSLQEVEYYTDRTKKLSAPRIINNNINMLNELAYLTGMQGMFFPIINVYGGKFGNAVLSKFGMEKTENILLPYVEGTEQRAASTIKFTLPNAIPVTFVATHLDMDNEANGMNQVKKLNELFKNSGLTIAAGDLNARLGTQPINELSTVWKLAISNEFDHIFFNPKDSWIVKEQKVFSEINFSDHKPIMVTLQLNQ